MINQNLSDKKRGKFASQTISFSPVMAKMPSLEEEIRRMELADTRRPKELGRANTE